MQIIDIGNAIFVVDQIAYITKETEDYNGMPTIKVFLSGNPTPFVVTLPTVEERDKEYSKWCKAILEHKRENP